MADLKVIQLSKKEAIYKWQKLDNLATNGNIPDEKGWYAVQRAHAKLYPAIKPIYERRGEIERQMIKRDNLGRYTQEFNEGYTFEDFEKAVEKIESPTEMIDIEIYQIKLSTLKNATIMNVTRQQVKIPPALITDLQEWIIDDFEESEEKENEDIQEQEQGENIRQFPKK